MHPGEGVAMHTHSDVDNLLIVLSGTCHHDDSDGHSIDLHAGDVSLLAAGRAMAHAEHVQGSDDLEVLVVLLEPVQRGGASQHLTARLDDLTRHNRLQVFASGGRFASGQALPLRSESRVLSAQLDAGRSFEHVFQHGVGYICVLGGAALVDGRRLAGGDRALIDGGGTLRVEAVEDAQIFVVEMAAG